MKRQIGKNACFIVFVSLCGFVRSITCAAGELPPSGSIGISALVQSSQLDLLLPIWSGDQVVIAPSFSFNSVGASFTDIGIGGLFRVYLRQEKAAPYVGARASVLILKPDEGGAVNDYLIGGLFGGEYFFDPHFSVAVEGQLNVAISDNSSLRFANPGEVNINTATGVFAAVYF